MAISYDWPAEGERSLIGKRINRLDGPDKATGRAKYAYDRNVTGMIVARLVTSPHAHARITAIDSSAAERLPGYRGIEIINGVGTEVQWQGLEIAAVAADTEELASDALEKIEVTYEELPFTVDPLQSLYPGGPNARTNGNSVQGPELRTVKWTAQDFAAVAEGQLPQGAPTAEWSFGDTDAGFARAKVVLDETFVTAGLAHHSMEPRSALA